MKRSRRSTHPVYRDSLGARAALAGGPAAWERFWGGAEEGREAWAVLGPQLTRNAIRPPAVWWAYEPGVPDELRREVEPPDPRRFVEIGQLVPGAEAYRAHKLARVEWLLQSGRLGARDTEQARHLADRMREAVA